MGQPQPPTMTQSVEIHPNEPSYVHPESVKTFVAFNLACAPIAPQPIVSKESSTVICLRESVTESKWPYAL